MGRILGLDRNFSAFPGGPAGLGLLLLRFAAGTSALYQGYLYITDSGHSVIATVAGVLALLSGLLLLAGLLTLVAGTLFSVVAIAILVSWLPALRANALDGKPVALLIATIGVSVALLGPGRCSLDAFLFGRREIIIPPASRSTEL